MKILIAFYCMYRHISELSKSISGQTTTSEVCGCSPYGTSTIAGARNEREISDIEKQGAYFQGKQVALIAKKLN